MKLRILKELEYDEIDYDDYGEFSVIIQKIQQNCPNTLKNKTNKLKHIHAQTENQSTTKPKQTLE